jgi:hypothetical protein
MAEVVIGQRSLQLLNPLKHEVNSNQLHHHMSGPSFVTGEYVCSDHLGLFYFTPILTEVRGILVHSCLIGFSLAS